MYNVYNYTPFMTQIMKTFGVHYPDRVIQIDAPSANLRFVANEVAQFQTKNVVDLLMSRNIADNAQQGTLTLTNLRVIYTLDCDQTINMSIGYAKVHKILVGNIAEVSSKQQNQPLIQQNRTIVSKIVQRGFF